MINDLLWFERSLEDDLIECDIKAKNLISPIILARRTVMITGGIIPA